MPLVILRECIGQDGVNGAAGTLRLPGKPKPLRLRWPETERCVLVPVSHGHQSPNVQTGPQPPLRCLSPAKWS